MKRVLVNIREKYEGKTIFVVSHGDPIAFTMWRLLNLEEKLPSIAELNRYSYYPKKAEAWRIVFDREGRVTEYELLSREEGLVK